MSSADLLMAVNKRVGDRRRRTITLHNGRLRGPVEIGNRGGGVEPSDVG